VSPAVTAVFPSLIALSLVAWVWLAWQAPEMPSPIQEDLASAMDWLLKGSTGALVGYVTCQAGHRRNLE
jgi:hypothetical protein